jgi:hypothetical protein
MAVRLARRKNLQLPAPRGTGRGRRVPGRHRATRTLASRRTAPTADRRQSCCDGSGTSSRHPGERRSPSRRAGPARRARTSTGIRAPRARSARSQSSPVAAQLSSKSPICSIKRRRTTHAPPEGPNTSPAGAGGPAGHPRRLVGTGGRVEPEAPVVPRAWGRPTEHLGARRTIKVSLCRRGERGRASIDPRNNARCRCSAENERPRAPTSSPMFVRRRKPQVAAHGDPSTPGV